MSAIVDLVVLAALVVGSAFTLLGAFALVRLPTFFQRIHGPTKASTLGVGCLLLASILYHWQVGNGLHPREILISVFLFFTAPISAHMLSLAALRLARPEDRPQPPAAGVAAGREPEPALDDARD